MTENAKWTPPPPTNIPEGKYPVWNGEEWLLEDHVDGNYKPVEYDKTFVCKMQAKTFLLETDFAMLPDVKISNKEEFGTYRNKIRELYFNPVEDPVWPEVPIPQWI